MISNQKSIAIIGGGPAGLVSGKTALECGFIPTVFEKNSNFGGTWSPNTTKAWNSMKTNISKYSCTFSDFPLVDKDIGSSKDELFSSQTQVYNYLYSYAKKFDVLQYIKTNCTVTKVSRIQDTDTWSVEWIENGVSKQRIYDFIIISTGINSKPAPFEQSQLLKSFSGRVIHTVDFKSPESYTDKRVLIIGNAFSGSQIASDVSSVAKCVYQIKRRENQWVLPSMLSMDVDSENEIRAPLDFFFYVRKQTYDNITLPFEKYNQLMNSTAKVLSKSNRNIEQFPYDESKFDTPPYFIIPNEDYLALIKSGDIKLLSNYSISSVNGNQITLCSTKNETQTLEFDEIILANGYHTDLSYLDQEILNEIKYDPNDYYVSCLLHKNVFPSKFKNIGFVGIINTPFFMTLEVMSRWVCYTFANIVKYPTQETIQSGIKDQLEIRNKDPNLRYQFPYIDMIASVDDLAKEAGVLPNFDEIKSTDPQLYQELWNSLYCGASLRLNGPFSDYSLAKETINRYSNLYKSHFTPKKKSNNNI